MVCFFLTFLSGFSLDFTLFSFYFSSTNNGIGEGQALLGVKAPLGLAHVKKKRDKKVSEKHKLDQSAELVAFDTCH